MKKIFISIAALSLLFGSCATVKQNVDARMLLSKCTYEFAGLSAVGVKFSHGIEIDSVDFTANVKITNTAGRDVALDHAEIGFYLDQHHITDIEHKKFIRIAPEMSATEPVTVTIPFADIIKTLGHRPEKIGVKAKLWVTLLVGAQTWETPIVIPVEVEVPVPYDQIQVFIDKQQKQLEEKAADTVEKETKKILPKIKAPKF